MAAEAQHQQGAPEAPPSRAWIGWLVQVLLLAYAATVLFDDFEQCLSRAAIEPRAGTVGVQFDYRRMHDGYYPVVSVKPDGAMARAGIAAGDEVRYDRAFDSFRKLRAGEQVGFTLVHAARSSHHLAIAQPRKPDALDDHTRIALIYDIATSMAALLGAFIIWRSRRQTTTLLLGAALLAYGKTTTLPQLWLSAPAVFPFAFGLGIANYAAISILFYAFAKRFYGDHVSPPKPWEKAAFWLYAALQVVVSALFCSAFLMAVSFPLIGTGEQAQELTTYLGLAVCLVYMVLGWRRSAASVQQRYALLLVAASAIMAAQVLDTLWALNSSEAAQTIHYLANSLLSGVIASGLFAYAILRRKVFDLGFAVNRTLVYAVVSAILLAAFGLIEWAVDHFVPIEGREKNALVDAAIAVGVFLTFHRVRDAVEHGIEGLFFRRWQKAEAQLRRFVREAAFITEQPALTRAFAQALGQFGEGAQAAVYLQEGAGYQRAAGSVEGAAAHLESNLPALVSVRADLKALEIQEGALEGALIAPMVNRNEVIGVTLVKPKPSGLGWRPDEIELIGWATRQVGLDLHALKVERLEAMAAAQREEIARAEARNQELRLALGARA